MGTRSRRDLVRERGRQVVGAISPTSPARNPVLLAVALAAITANYLVAPLGQDLRINLAFAHQAAISGSFPGNVVDAWTIRGLGYQFVVYALYTVGRAIAGYENKAVFETAVRVLMAGNVLSVVAASLWVAEERLTRAGLDIHATGFLVAASFLTLSHWVAFQAEDLASLLVVLGVALGISRKRGSNAAAGLAFAFVFTLKGITGLLIPVGILLVAVFDGGLSRRARATAAWSAAWTVGLTAGMLLFAPSGVSDLVEATAFQSTFETPLGYRLLRTGYYFFLHLEHLPILLPGAGIGLLFLRRNAREREYVNAVVLLSLALLPLSIVFVQAQWFGYHYAVLVPTAIALFLWMGEGRPVSPAAETTGAFVATFLLLSVAFVSPVSPFDRSSPARWEAVSGNETAVYAEIEERLDITAEDTVLYLADGTPNYYLDAGSHLRYFYPLPLQRVPTAPGLRDTEVFRRTLDAALAYEGPYVVLLEEWFPLEAFPELEEKLDDEYCIAYESTIKPDSAYADTVVVYARDEGECS